MRNGSILAAVIAVTIVSCVTRAEADDAGERLYSKYLGALSKVTSLQADVRVVSESTRGHGEDSSGYLVFKRPNLVRTHFSDKVHRRTQDSVSDGKTAYAHSSDSTNALVCDSNQYIGSWSSTCLGMVVSPNTVIKNARQLGFEPRVGKRITVGKDLLQTLEFEKDGDYYRFHLASDMLPRRVETGIGNVVTVLQLSNVRLNQPVAASIFEWQPPQSVKRLPIHK